MFIVLLCIIQDVHSATLHYAVFIVLHFIIHYVSAHLCFVLLQSYVYSFENKSHI